VLDRHPFEGRYFRLAGRAPRHPEIEQDDLAPKFVEGDELAIGILFGEGGGRLGDEALRRGRDCVIRPSQGQGKPTDLQGLPKTLRTASGLLCHLDIY
jgi:hypothetical protein